MWEGKEGWTGMVRNPGPCSSSIDTGIIPSPEPSPHWLASRLGFSLRLGPWHHGYYFSWCGCLFSGRLACSWNGLSWLFGTLARRCKWAEYITNFNTRTLAQHEFCFSSMGAIFKYTLKERCKNLKFGSTYPWYLYPSQPPHRLSSKTFLMTLSL